MLYKIGHGPREKKDLVELLNDCHVRIRSFIRLAVVVGEADVESLPRAEVVDACASVERYFSEALPLHVRDEEESVLPRLIGRSSSVDAALERMHEQHALHDEVLQRVLFATTAVRLEPSNQRLRSALLAVARPMEALFEAHLRSEEAVVFPAVRTLVCPEEQRAILSELRGRRA